MNEATIFNPVSPIFSENMIMARVVSMFIITNQEDVSFEAYKKEIIKSGNAMIHR